MHRAKNVTSFCGLSLAFAIAGTGVFDLYDGLGRRVQKTEPSQTTLYHYDASGRIISETSPTGAKLRDYIYLGNKLVAVDGCITVSPPAACTERQWYHTDVAGSVLARSDSSGNVVRFDYQPWGEPWTAPTAAAGDRQYNGRIFDPGTGFHDYGARMYLPEIGRFISVDSAGANLSEPTTFNRYAYVLNNPYKYADPNGRVAFLAVTGLIGAAAGAIYGAISSANSEEGFNWGAVGKWGTIGAVAGLTLGAGTSLLVTGGATVTASVAEVSTAGMALLGIGGEGARRTVERGGPVTSEGLATIESHLGRLGALEDPANTAMLERLKAGQTSIQDLNFYEHELMEAAQMIGSDYGYDAARAAHLETLQWQGIPFEPGYESLLYHPDVISQFSENFNPEAWPK